MSIVYNPLIHMKYCLYDKAILKCCHKVKKIIIMLPCMVSCSYCIITETMSCMGAVSNLCSYT